MPAQEMADLPHRLPVRFPDGGSQDLRDQGEALFLPQSPEEDFGPMLPGDPPLYGSHHFGPLLGGDHQHGLRAEGGGEGVQVFVGEAVVHDDEEAAVGGGGPLGPFFPSGSWGADQADPVGGLVQQVVLAPFEPEDAVAEGALDGGVLGQGGEEGGFSGAGDAGHDDAAPAGAAPVGPLGEHLPQAVLLFPLHVPGGQVGRAQGRGLRLPLLPPVPERPGFLLLEGFQGLPDVFPGPAQGGDGVQGIGHGPVGPQPGVEVDEQAQQAEGGGPFSPGQPVGEGADPDLEPVGHFLVALAGLFQPVGQRLAENPVSRFG
jgi:hypothetical protein